MSFSSEIKEDLSRHVSGARHCQIAELAAILVNEAEFLEDGSILLRREHERVLRKTTLLTKKLFNADIIWGEMPVLDAGREDGDRRSNSSNAKKSTSEHYRISDSVLKEKMKNAIKYKDGGSHRVSEMLLKNSCCKRAFLQASYLCIGSMSDPEKSYHLEFVCADVGQAVQIQEMIKEFELEAKVTVRKKYHIVYLKESAAIVELLNIIGAHKALMDMENSRILKEVRSSVNRICNCDSANINKTIKAAQKQIEDIYFLRDHYGFENLPDNLREMAVVRLENPETPLKELGELLDPPVGKSGVNHRLRKLSEIADEHRN